MQIAFTVVVPFYQSSETVQPLYSRLKSVFEKINQTFEVIYVDDSGQYQETWNRIVALSEQESSLIGIRLSRNFGQHVAITAGLEEARGTIIVVMDCDLQDQPEEIERLAQKLSQGYDYVLARRYDRQDSLYRRTISRSFYFALSYTTGVKHDSAVANFGVYSRSVIDAVISLRESSRYFPVMVRWVGFRGTYLDVQHAARESGKSSYNLKKMSALALDILMSYSVKPLYLVVALGLSISFLSIIMTAYFVYEGLIGRLTVVGWPSLFVSLWFLSGAIIFVLGCIGVYLGKVFEQVKNRPIYIKMATTGYRSRLMKSESGTF